MVTLNKFDYFLPFSIFFCHLLFQLCGISLSAGYACSAEIALFANSEYVDYTPANDAAEASGAHASLLSLGHNVTIFTAITETSVDSAITGKNILVIPELEKNPSTSLLNSLESGSKERVEEFVRKGGILINMVDTGNRGLDLMNDLFHFQLSRSSETIPAQFLRQSVTEAKFFSKVPSPLLPNNATRPLSIASLPVGGSAIFANGDSSAITLISYGQGYIIIFGWDWFDSQPRGTADGGWLSALSSAASILSSTRSAAVLTNPLYVEYIPAATGAEASNLERSLLAKGISTERFIDIGPTTLSNVLANKTILAIPELELNPTPAFPIALSATSKTIIQDFVHNGGILLTFADSSLYSDTLLNTLFGFSIVRGSPAMNYPLFVPDAAGTGFTTGVAALPPNNATKPVKVESLPVEARAVYRTNIAPSTDVTALWFVPVGKGWVVYSCWDWFDAQPVGSLDNGWLDALATALSFEPAYGTAALLTDNTYVEYNPGSSAAEASNLEQSLLNLSWNVEGFTGTTATTLSTALANKKALVIPDLERSPATSFLDAMDASARNQIIGFVNNGGILITFADSGYRSDSLLNSLFGFSLTRGVPAATYNLNENAAAGTPFTSGLATIPPNNQTRVPTIASLPPMARAIYRNSSDLATDTAAIWFVPVGKGFIVYFGWDWYSAAPAGTADAGWLSTLNAALSLGQTKSEVALFSNIIYVDYIPGASAAEGSNLEQSLLNLQYHVRKFDYLQSNDLTTALNETTAVIFPDLEKNANPSLLDSLDEQARRTLKNYVNNGGIFMTFSDGSLHSDTLLNTLFGFSLIRGSTVGNYLLNPNPEATQGTPFANGPASLPSNNLTRSPFVSSLPPNARAIYSTNTDPLSDTAAVWCIPMGKGWIVSYSWDWFNAVPTGTQDSGWLDVLNKGLHLPPMQGILAGDITGDGVVTIKDAIVSLQIMAGYPAVIIDIDSEINADSRIGVAESIYALRKVAGFQ